MTLRKSILGLLAERPLLSGQECLVESCSRYRTISKQAVYLELRRLIKDGIVCRADSRYSLNLSWVIETLGFAERAYGAALQSMSIENLLSDTKKKKVFRFRNLQAADDFWIQVILCLLSHTKAKRVYQWDPYLWFLLLSATRDDRFHRARHRAQAEVFGLVGSDSQLNTFLLKEWKQSHMTRALVPIQTGLPASTHFSVIENYIVKIQLTPATTAKLKRIFVSSIRTREAELAMEDHNCGVSISVEHSLEKSEKFRELCRRHMT